MRESHHDYGPSPFRFFYYWFELEGFDTFVKQTWNDAQVTDSNAISMFMKKMKYLKEKIRMWVKANKENSKNHKQCLQEELSKIDLFLDKGEGNSTLISKRMEILKSIQDLSIRHMRCSKSRRSMAIKDRFNKPPDYRLHIDLDFPNKLSLEQQMVLEIEVSREEIKKAVWDCGVDKSPGPDGFTFGFYRRYWTFLENDVVEAVLYFFNHGKFPKGIHGEDGKIGKHVSIATSVLRLDIVKEVQHIQRQGTDLMGFIHRKMGNGTQKNISVALKLSHDDLLCSFRRAPRAGAEELQYIHLKVNAYRTKINSEE
ncbi:hypothetical protein Tco_1570384 [Tanacetum coccineum]